MMLKLFNHAGYSIQIQEQDFQFTFQREGEWSPPLGGGHKGGDSVRKGGECRVKRHYNRIEKYCVFNGYLKTDIQLKDIL